jgi:methionyl-tRNA formyltransferase
LSGKRIKVYDSKVVDINKSSDTPGKIDVIDNSRIIVHCGDNKLELLEIQVAGKQRMSVIDWLKGAQINSGDFLG